MTDIDEATLRAIHLTPYEAAIEAGVRIVMASFSSTGERQGPWRPPPAERGAQGRARVHGVRRVRLGRRRPGRMRTTTRRSRRPSPPASTWSWSRTTGPASRRRSAPGSTRGPSKASASTTRSRGSCASSSSSACSRHPMPPAGRAADLGSAEDRSTGTERGGRVGGAAQDLGRSAAARRYRRRAAGGVGCERHRPPVRRLDDRMAGSPRARSRPARPSRTRWAHGSAIA